MYEKPELTPVGEAEDVILGFAINGDDLDMNWTYARPAYSEDTIANDE